MKLVTVVILSILLSCSAADDAYPPLYPSGGETVTDGLEWYDVVYFYYTDGSASDGGTRVHINSDYIEGDGINNLAMIEFDDDKDYVGAERGRITNGKQQYVYGFNLEILPGYIIKIKKGADITQDQFLEAMVDYNNDGQITDDELCWIGTSLRSFEFEDITGKESIMPDSVLAELVIYDRDDEAMTKSLGSFFIVL